MTELRISESLSLPIEAATHSIGIVGQRGGGKTYLASVLAEEMHATGVPFAVLDPLGVWWGLRCGAQALPIPILGGEHGDFQILAEHGGPVGSWLAGKRRSCILDMSALRRSDQRLFATDLARSLYQENRAPLHIFLDEADLWAPQRASGTEERELLGAWEDVVRRGRARGLGCTMITQRPACIHKDVLTQISALAILRLAGPQDRAAVDEWIRYHGREHERGRILASLATLPIGAAWWWSPGWMGVLRRIQVRERRTFDSSATPELAGPRVASPTLWPIDRASLGAELEEVSRHQEEDPKALRVRVRQLEAELAGVRRAATSKVRALYCGCGAPATEQGTEARWTCQRCGMLGF